MSEAPQNQIFVAGYSKNRVQDKQDIKELLKDAGPIKEIAYKGSFAFVTFDKPEDATKACDDFNGKSIGTLKLKVEMVDNRGGGRKRDASQADECFNCGEKGHWARDCRKKSHHHKRRSQRGRRSPSSSVDSHRRHKRRHRKSRSRSRSSSDHSRRRGKS